ncbi:MAG: hypothetical protein ACRD3V_21485 [Vicinamibacteria bacterium]
MADEKNETEAPKIEAGYFNMKRILVDPAAAPTVAHHIMWTRIGHEYTLEVAHFDPLAVRDAIRKEAKTPEEANMVDLYVTHRFSMSSENVERFIQTLDELKADLKRLKSNTQTEKGREE